jgi:hypothetical protein
MRTKDEARKFCDLDAEPEGLRSPRAPRHCSMRALAWRDFLRKTDRAARIADLRFTWWWYILKMASITLKGRALEPWDVGPLTCYLTGPDGITIELIQQKEA